MQLEKFSKARSSFISYSQSRKSPENLLLEKYTKKHDEFEALEQNF